MRIFIHGINNIIRQAKVVKENVEIEPVFIPTPVADTDRPSDVPGLFAGKVQENNNAKVIIELFEDFEDPFSLAHTSTISQILDKYGDQINLIIKHTPLEFNNNAQKAAESFECAKEQGKAWEMHDKIFEQAAAKYMTVDIWKSVAINLGLDSSQFNDCLDNEKYVDKIKDDQAEGKQRKIRGTPITFINGEAVFGAAPYDQIKIIVENNL